MLALAGEIQTRLTVHTLTRACLDSIHVPSYAYYTGDLDTEA